MLATQAIANVIKSSFGPSGLDKMMVDDIGVSNLIPIQTEYERIIMLIHCMVRMLR